MAQLNPCNVVLLTGAGFTKTFGGYVAREMWARIFNHPAVQRNQTLRNCMLNQLNFESAYSAIMETGNYSDEGERAITEALRSAFQQMHNRIFEPMNQSKESIWNVFDLFLKPFVGGQDEYGLFFTLTQDSCVEVAYSNSGDKSFDIDLLGITPKEAWFRDDMLNRLEEEPIFLPNQERVEEIKSQFDQGDVSRLSYIKLHGSYGWRKRDGSEAMVIGNMKSRMIIEEPLLYWYHELFRQSLLNKTQRLVVIGYAFRDPHINSAIADGISNGDLRLYIVNPADPEDFHFDLKRLPPDPNYRRKHIGDVIWEALAGYHQGQVTDFYHAYDLTQDGEYFLERLGILSNQ